MHFPGCYIYRCYLLDNVHIYGTGMLPILLLFFFLSLYAFPLKGALDYEAYILLLTCGQSGYYCITSGAVGAWDVLTVGISAYSAASLPGASLLHRDPCRRYEVSMCKLESLSLAHKFANNRPQHRYLRQQKHI